MNSVNTSSCYLADIDFDDRTFPFSYGLLPASLEISVVKVGLLQPPLLLSGDKGLKIVCGRRRLEVLKRLTDGAEKISFYLVENSSAKELFRRALWENLAFREFNLVETADIYVAASQLFTADEIEREIMPALKLPLRPRFRLRCQAITEFPGKLRDLLALGIFDAETVDLVGEWSDDERSALTDLVKDAGLRRNKLREVVSRLDDLARRDKVSPLKFLSAARKAAFCEDGSIAVELLRGHLKALLYPHLTAARQEFAINQEKFSWPANLRLDPPPDFEGGDYRLSFTFTDSREWEKICDKLNSVALEDIDELCQRG